MQAPLLSELSDFRFRSDEPEEVFAKKYDNGYLRANVAVNETRKVKEKM